MTKYFREKTTGPEEVYRAGNFVSRIFELIPDAKVLSEGEGRYNDDDKGQSYCPIFQRNKFTRSIYPYKRKSFWFAKKII